MRTIAKKSLEGVKNKMKEHIHSRIAKILVVLALAVVASVMFVFVGCNNECAHENTHNEVVAAATCTTEGITRTVCDDCGHVTESKTAALGHDWDEGTVVAATCTAGGYTLQTCSRCTAQRQVESTEPTGHTWNEGKVVAATCTTGGYTLQTCEACGAQQQVNPTEPTGHNYAIDESKTVAGTCLTNGSVTYVCADCGDTYTEQTALGQHNYEKVTVASTCTTAGYTAERCTVCGNERNRENLPLAKHNFERDDEHSYAATCTVDGVEIEVCANCGITNTYTLKATGHKWGEAETVAPTCTKDGYSIHTCTVCNTEQRYATVEAAGHKWDNETVLTQEPTCTERGYSYVPCLNCTERQTIDILDPLGHSFVYSTKTVITPATCTTNGSMTAPCTRCGTMHTYTGNQLAAMDADDLNALNIPTEVFEKAEYNLVNTGAYPTEDGAFTFLVSPHHDYAHDNKYACVTMETKADGTELWNKCNRCKTEWETVDHTMPAGALPCVSMYNNDAMSAAEKAKYDEATQKAYAYACTVCGGLQAIQNHDFAVYNLDPDKNTGNPMFDPWEDCTFILSDDQSMTELTCEDYLICKDCNHIEVAAPHTRPTIDDKGYYNTCGHGHLCLICELELTMPLKHNTSTVVSNEANAFYMGEEKIGYLAPTCTEDGYNVTFCKGCVDRSAYEEVVWEEGVNYTKTSIDKLNHYDWATGKFTTETVSRKGDDEVINCLDGTWYRDICNTCDAYRISVKPTLYTKSKGEFVELKTEEAYNNAVDAGTGIYTAANDEAKVNSALDQTSWKNDRYGRPWTDENGYYGGKEPGEHSWQLLPLEEYTDAQLKQYQAINCVDNGYMLLYCPVCGNVDGDGTVSHVQTWAEFRHKTNSESEYSLATYAWLAGYTWTEDDKTNGSTLYGDQDGNGVVNIVDKLISDMKAKGTWHKGAMNECGHDLCSACTFGNHNPQYAIDIIFHVDLKFENISQFAFYSCRNNAQNQERLTNTLNELIYSATAQGKVYNFAYYTDPNFTTETTIAEFFIATITSDSDIQNFADKTLYVKLAEEVDLNGKNEYFDTTFNAATINWYKYQGDENYRLDVEFSIYHDQIDYRDIQSITVEVADGETVLASAVSEGEALEKLWKAAAGSASWATGPDGSFVQDAQWLSVGWFCRDLDKTTNEEGNWIFAYDDSFVNGQELKGCTVTITIVTDTATWVSTQTVTASIAKV